MTEQAFRDFEHRIIRIEATLEEFQRALNMFAGDKRWTEQEKQKLEKLRSEKK